MKGSELSRRFYEKYVLPFVCLYNGTDDIAPLPDYSEADPHDAPTVYQR
jgi:hypothetical protein